MTRALDGGGFVANDRPIDFYRANRLAAGWHVAPAIALSEVG
jgi:hypothetical protein